MSNMLTNGAMFSTFKRTDSHTVRGRPTRKDGVVIYERLLRFPIERGARQVWRPSLTVKTLMLSLVTVLVSIGNISRY